MKKWLIASFVVAVAIQLVEFDDTRSTIATHFGAGGHANGTMSPLANLLIGSGTLLLITLLFLFVPLILAKTPIKMISFPNRDYWFNPVRKEQSIRIISGWLQFFGIANNLFFIGIYHLTHKANQLYPPRLDERAFFQMMAVYGVVLIFWLVGLYIRFRQPPKIR